jgi:phosphate transport system substrate-binding protein
MLRRKYGRTFGIIAVFALVLALVAPSMAQAAISIKLSGSTTVYPLAQAWAAKYKSLYKGSSITVAAGGSSTGIKDAAAGRVDIGMSSREKLSTDDQSLVFTPVARDAVVLIMNPKNTVKKLTATQVNYIYRGKYTNWKQVGGPNAAIIVCGRTGASGTYQYFRETFLANLPQTTRTKAYASNGLVRSAVARNKYAIGYVSAAYINSTVRAAYIKPAGKTAYVYPSKTNMQKRIYPYVRYLYFVTKGVPAGEAKTFTTWCRGSVGQAIATKEYLTWR